MNLGWWGCGLCGGSVSHAFCCGKDKVWVGCNKQLLADSTATFTFQKITKTFRMELEIMQVCSGNRAQ